MKRVMRHLKGTRELGIVFWQDPDTGQNRHDPETPWGFCDANYAEDPCDQKSTSGYVFMFAGGPISWKSKKQPSVSLSMTEAEYIAGAYVAKEIMWIRMFMKEIARPLQYPTLLYCDNQSTIATAKNPENHERTKHIDISYHLLRELVEDGTIKMEYCPTDENVADIFTKALARPKIEKFADGLGMERRD